jgi:outer membrane lipoprotein carrier protein
VRLQNFCAPDATGLAASRRLPWSRTSLVTVVLSLVLVLPAAESTGSIEDSALMSRLQHHYRTTDSFTAEFVETLTSPGGTPRQRTGKVSYRKPGMIRWEFDPPQPETIVADGTTLYDYDPGLNQVVEMPERNAFRDRAAAAFILGAGDLERDYDGRTATDSGKNGAVHLILTPKGGGVPVELAVDNETLDIIRLSTADALGNTTELRFSDIQRNVTLPTTGFAFTVPAGADIVKTAPAR